MNQFSLELPSQTVSIEGMALPAGMDHTYKQAHELLITAKNYLLAGDWEHAAECCKNFLTELQFTHHPKQAKGKEYHNFQFIASKMLRNNHNFDSVITLKEIYDRMISFTDSYFRHIIKKGVSTPTPALTREEAYFIYSFCVGFFNMILLPGIE